MSGIAFTSFKPRLCYNTSREKLEVQNLETLLAVFENRVRYCFSLLVCEVLCIG